MTLNILIFFTMVFNALFPGKKNEKNLVCLHRAKRAMKAIQMDCLLRREAPEQAV